MTETTHQFSRGTADDPFGTPTRSSREDTKDVFLKTEKMLSVDFSNPLAGEARSERIRQMTNNHPAFEKSRMTQEVLVKVQTTLRRMPGVAAAESNEIITQLQEVGQVVSQETSQLVDALMNLTLDQEETDKAVARLSIQANLAKAEANDKAQSIAYARKELSEEKNKREQAEADMKKMMQEFEELTSEIKSLKVKAEQKRHSPLERDEMVKSLEETISHLEDQVNNRRSLWVMKNPNPQAVARAMETLADSVQDNEMVHKTLKSMKSEDTKAGAISNTDSSGTCNSNNNLHKVATPRAKADPVPTMSRGHGGDLPLIPRPPSVFQASMRPPTAGPPKFTPFAAPPRAPSAFQPERRAQNYMGFSASAVAQPRARSFTNGMYQSSAFGRTPSRRGYQYNMHNSRPRQGVSEYSSFMPTTPDSMISRPSAAAGYSRECFPQRPRSNRTPQENSSTGSDGYGNMAIAHRSDLVGPLIHVSERAVDAWNEHVMKFYSIIRSFVEKNANEPVEGMAALGSNVGRLGNVLIATYSPLSEYEAASYLEIHLREENSKSCLVTRVIIDYVVNRVWIPGAWMGLDPETTYALVDLTKDLERTHAQPSFVRQPLLDRQASIIDAILAKRDQTPEFTQNKIEGIASTILDTLQPLLNQDVNMSDVYPDLLQVVESAWDLSSKILTSRLTFDFRFPEIGSRFSSQSMLPIWPNLDPSELQARHWRVALVTTPVITCRNDTGTNISAHSVALADVVCMQ